MEVTMLPNASYDTRQPLVRPASHPANDAGLRTSVSTAKLRLLHARTWAGISAELFEMHATDRGQVELPGGKTRLLVMLNEVGGRTELRTNPYREVRSDYQGPNHISLLPEGERAWCCVDRLGYCR